jgi:hypothetical protein
MIVFSRNTSVRTLYRLTVFTALAGTLFFLVRTGPRNALAFLLGAAISLGNLWLFDRLARSIEPPATHTATPRKSWQAGAFVTRYLIFFAAGYAIVKSLDVSPLPVVLGLFASTAAVLLSSLGELLGSLRNVRRNE